MGEVDLPWHEFRNQSKLVNKTDVSRCTQCTDTFSCDNCYFDMKIPEIWWGQW